MIYGVTQKFKNESIIYQRINDTKVKKCYYDNNGNKVKEKVIDICSKNQGKAYKNTQDFFTDMICFKGYCLVD